MSAATFARNVIALLLAALTVFSAHATAQTGLPGTAPTPPPAPSWETVLPGGGYEYFPTPDQACRRQHQAFNPYATYQAPTYKGPWTYACNWIASQYGGPPGSTTVLPTSVYMGCPSGFSRTPIGECRDVHDNEPECDCTEPSRKLAAGPAPLVGNPISITTGSKVEFQSDFETADGLFGVDRAYRSIQHSNRRQSGTAIPGFGPNWHGVLPGRLAAFGYYADYVEYLSATGGYELFVVTGNSTYLNTWTFTAYSNDLVRVPNGRRKLEVVSVPVSTRRDYFQKEVSVPNSPGEFKLTESDGSYVLYRRADAWSAAEGIRYLVPVEQVFPGGYTRYFDYPDAGQFPNKVRDSFGREMLLSWAETKPRSISIATGASGGGPSGANIIYNTPQQAKVITQIVLPDATRLVYTYNGTATETRIGRDDRLTKVSRRDANDTELWAREYLYEDGSFPYALTGIVDENGQRLSTYSYHPYGLAATSERAGGVGRVEVDYSYQLTGSSLNTKLNYRAVTNPLGRQENYSYWRQDADQNIPSVMTQTTGLATASVAADSQSLIYEAKVYSNVRLVKSTTDRRGFTTTYSNDPNNLRPLSITEAAGTTSARTTNIQWHATLDLPARVDVPGLRTEYTYGTTGEVLTRTLTDTTTHTLPYSTAGQTRTDTYTWGTGGRLASINGPRAAAGSIDDITSFTYDSAGNLLTMTNGLGQVTTFASYDAAGRPGSMTDPNAVQTLFTYDALGRLLTSTVKHPSDSALDAVTSYEYDIEGRVTGITLPATQKLGFVYDLAGQLLEINSADGEKQTFAHDAMGNVTEQKIERSDGTPRSTITRTFDSIGRMLTETLGTGRTTAWEYDKNGNPVRTTSPRSFATDMAFDPLNRLTQSVAPDTGATATAYNAKDETTSFTDAVSVQTTFVRNGFGEVIREVSPDRGTSTYYYDAAGDMTAAIDGRGQRIDYTRDILGRVTTKTPAGRPSSEIITYTYDSGGISGCACVGRLASMTDASGTTNFSYDHRGNLTAKAQAVGTLAWTYDLADRVVQITYPSGRDVAYTRDTQGRVTEVTTRPDSGSSWTALATNITYEPFGSMKSADLGNGLKLSLDWGSDRRLASKRLYSADGTDVWHLSYAYDNGDNITAITDLVTSANSRSFGYDSLDRLTRVDSDGAPFAREDYVHDKNGNRTAAQRRTNVGDATPAETDAYTRTSGTNRIASIAPASGGTRAFTHDARGNLTGETRPGGPSLTLGYDGYARLASYAVAGAETQAMLYNGFDERVGLTTSLGGSPVAERRYIYDEGHRITGEYGATTATLYAEYIWFQPEVGAPSAFGGDDGLGGYMPLAVAVPDISGTKLQWTQGNHLGTPVVTTDASGAIVSPSSYGRIGFPGQVQQHADLYYNYYRDYDPTLGRYVQADPVGLDGDNNAYLYADANPLLNTDPAGLECLILSKPSTLQFRRHSEQCKRVDQPGVLNVFGHGSATKICEGSADRITGRCYDAYEFYFFFKKEILRNFSIKSWACNNGSQDDGIARELADISFRSVVAADGYTTWNNTLGFIGVYSKRGTYDQNFRSSFITFTPHFSR